MMQHEEKPKDPTVQNMKRMALVTFSAGCLTLVIAGLAILVGFVIDTRAGTLPRWTLIFLLGSAPFTMGGVYLIARRAVKKMQHERGKETQLDEGKSEK